MPALTALVEAGYAVIGVVTNPDEPVGRNQIRTPPPVKIIAEKYKIPVYQPAEKQAFGYSIARLREADLFIVAAYGKIIPKEIIALPRYGALNIHPSLLPRWRGPSPIQYTILSGDTETGVTIMQIDELMDHGPMIRNSKFKIQNSKISYRELHDILARQGAQLLIETLPKYIHGEITPIPQDDSRATFSKMLTKDSGRIDWSRPAEDIERMVRAFNPWPGAWTVWPSEKGIARLRIEEAEVFDDEVPGGSPGYVWQNETHPILIKTGRGNLAVTRLTLAGKKSLSAEEFLRGYRLLLGSTLI